jgi:hypothetical protein
MDENSVRSVVIRRCGFIDASGYLLSLDIYYGHLKNSFFVVPAGGNPVKSRHWIPAYAGMTNK